VRLVSLKVAQVEAWNGDERSPRGLLNLSENVHCKFNKKLIDLKQEFLRGMSLHKTSE
jgi:hypothetical protein